MYLKLLAHTYVHTYVHRRIRTHSHVLSFFDQGRWYPGKVTAAYEDDTYDILYDDNDTESHVPRALVRRDRPADLNVDPASSHVLQIARLLDVSWGARKGLRAGAGVGLGG